MPHLRRLYLAAGPSSPTQLTGGCPTLVAALCDRVGGRQNPLQTLHQFPLFAENLPSASFIAPTSDFSCHPRRFSSRRGRRSPDSRQPPSNPVATHRLWREIRPPARNLHPRRPLRPDLRATNTRRKRTKLAVRAQIRHLRIPRTKSRASHWECAA